MPNITVRNVPRDVYKALRESAKRHNRSLNGEILDMLTFEAEMARRRLELVRTLPELERFSEKIAKKYPHAPDSVELIREDRDTR